jgi:GDP-4-dehydro-6-deoxy-D-mannose reductase
MKVFVSGASGFIASNFINYLSKKKNFVIYGLTRNKKKIKNKKNVHIIKYNSLDEKQIFNLIKAHRPSKIFHFAAQSSLNKSWEKTYLTINNNFKNTLNYLNAIKKLNLNCYFYNISSSSVYQSSQNKIHENSKIKINSPYSLSKFCQEKISEIYHEKYGVKSVIIRPFSITGAQKKGDICSDWAKGIVNIENNIHKELKIGELKGIKRDFLHIDDFNFALEKIYKSKLLGVFNVCSGKAVSLTSLLKMFISKTSTKINVYKDIGKLRKNDDSCLVGNNKKLLSLGWRQKKKLENIVDDHLNFYRSQKTSIINKNKKY